MTVPSFVSSALQATRRSIREALDQFIADWNLPLRALEPWQARRATAIWLALAVLLPAPWGLAWLVTSSAAMYAWHVSHR